MSDKDVQQTWSASIPIEFSDRYSATGTPYPDLKTICEGHCEGMGCVPVWMDVRNGPVLDSRAVHPDPERDPELIGRWEAAHLAAGEHECDGYHFVVCPACEGTRLRPGVTPPDNWPPAVGSEDGVRPE